MTPNAIGFRRLRDDSDPELNQETPLKRTLIKYEKSALTDDELNFLKLWWSKNKEEIESTGLNRHCRKEHYYIPRSVVVVSRGSLQGCYVLLKGGATQIGVGTYNRVTLALNIDTYTFAAFRSGKATHVMANEISALEQCQNQEYVLSGEIVHYHGPWKKRVANCRDKEEKNIPKVGVLTDWIADYDLYSVVSHPVYMGYSDAELLKIALQVAYGIVDMKNVGLMNTDLKAENVLVKDTEVKTGDLGLVFPIGLFRDGPSGCPGYLPPEVVIKCIKKDRSAFKPDVTFTIWSMGILLNLMFGSKIIFFKMLQVFNEKDLPFLNEQIIKEFVNHHCPQRLNSEHIDSVIAACLEFSPENRITSEELVRRLESLYTEAFRDDIEPRSKNRVSGKELKIIKDFWEKTKPVLIAGNLYIKKIPGLSRSLLVIPQGRLKGGYALLKSGAKILGRGAFNRVTFALNIDTGDYLAFRSAREEDVKENELDALQTLTDTRYFVSGELVRYQSTWRSRANEFAVQQHSVKKIGLLMNCVAKWDLENILSDPSKHSLGYKKLLLIALEITLCMIEEKRLERVNLDLKPQNIFINRNYNVKIGDFGSVYKVGSRLSRISGTLGYIPPEVLYTPHLIVDSQNEIWSMGVILSRLFSTNDFFMKLADDFEPYLFNEKELHEWIEKFFPNHHQPTHTDYVIAACLQYKKQERVTAEELYGILLNIYNRV